MIMDAGKLLLFSLLVILRSQLCRLDDSIAMNETIRDGHILVSKSGIFGLGFFSPGTSRYRYLGIWHHTVNEKTLVWVANRNDPIKDFSGELLLNQFGDLVIHSYSHPEIPTWSTNVSVETTDFCLAQLLDSGNLVLIHGTRRRVVWQSFDHPVNTLLSGMKLGVNLDKGLTWFLSSWRSADDPGTGNFSVQLNPNGSPQFFLYKGKTSYLRTSPWPWKNYPDVYNYTFVSMDQEIYFSFFDHDPSVMVRMVLDDSGMFKRFVWHENDGQWREFWSVPKYRCDLYGQCGDYGICDPLKINAFECQCLPGYEPKSPRDWSLRDGSSGCIRKRLWSSNSCGVGDGFVKVEHVKLPDTCGAQWVHNISSKVDCERMCLRNCSCTAYATIRNDLKASSCLHWIGELVDTTKRESFDGYDLHVRVDAFELAENSMNSHSLFRRKRMLVMLMISASLTWSIIIIVLLWLRRRKRKGERQFRVRNTYIDRGSNVLAESSDLTIFTLSAIYAATENFSPTKILGQGGFGSVYKGCLPDGLEIAVKRLSKNSGQGIEEFKNEIRLIAKLQHRNLVKLLGCCMEGDEQILVYEYMPNNSLDSFLFDESKKPCLDWRKRVDIILGVARGILYLHHDSRVRVIHRDLKTSNILLDEGMNPKISDFGLARIYKGDHISDKTIRVVGTYGYMSPEYAVFGKFSSKSDVFSFGVMLLEIISGRKISAFCKEDPSLNLITYVWELWRENRALETIDLTIMESCPPNEALRWIQIALLCVQEDPRNRPTMLTVILMLNGEACLPSPGQPAFVLRKRCDDQYLSLVEEAMTEKTTLLSST
ncbi:G-type lectin S-receptor-like serine/threonine-protein kinase RKS1 [Linum perenne]